MDPVALSSVTVPDELPIVRDSPRPADQRNESYAGQFDWRTVFYDVYRSGRDIVFQGPPLFNFKAALRRDAWLGPRLKGLWPAGRLVRRHRCDEIRVRSDVRSLMLDGELGRFDVTVQPEGTDRFSGRRVLHTLSKDNDICWIIDWTLYHARVHGADALLLYDNASSTYDAGELQARLSERCRGVTVSVVDWPFPYGPQGGLAGEVGGRETPWDSDFCQTGSLQHARFRFLRKAASVLNADIDELVVSFNGRSIFEATENIRGGFIKFDGQWISTAMPSIPPGLSRHGDFLYRDVREGESCPPKWCIVPDRASHRRATWSVHNLFGSRHNRRVSDAFEYRHIRGISNNWKYDRSHPLAWNEERFAVDPDLTAALRQAELLVDPSA